MSIVAVAGAFEVMCIAKGTITNSNVEMEKTSFEIVRNNVPMFLSLSDDHYGKKGFKET